MHGGVVEFSPRWARRADRVDVRASRQPLALQERLQSICCRHDHVGAPHGRLNIHRLRAMQRSKALRAIRGPTPYPYFLELADMAKGLQMRMRLNSASQQCEHLTIFGCEILRHCCGNGGGSHLSDEAPIQERQRFPSCWLEEHNHGQMRRYLGPGILRKEAHKLGAHPVLGNRRHDAQESLSLLDGEHVAHGLNDPTSREGRQGFLHRWYELLVFQDVSDVSFGQSEGHWTTAPIPLSISRSRVPTIAVICEAAYVGIW